MKPGELFRSFFPAREDARELVRTRLGACIRALRKSNAPTFLRCPFHRLV